MLTMIAALKRLGRDQRGVSIVETALWLPLVAMAGLGGLEYTNFVLANQKLERIASVSAARVKLISRATATKTERWRTSMPRSCRPHRCDGNHLRIR